MKFMYNLRFDEIVPNLPLVQNHISGFVATSVKMYPVDKIWKCCQKIPLMMAYISDLVLFIIFFLFIRCTLVIIIPNEFVIICYK